MNTHIGTSGWIYRDWVGPFYPKELKDIDKLAYFAKHFSTVEINSTFYHMPLETSVQRWHDAVPDEFTYSIKLNRYLTHTKRLMPDEDFDTTLHDFFDRIHYLGNKLGVVLVQLPPSMKADVTRIQHLIKQRDIAKERFAIDIPLAFEFRHVSWFSDEIIDFLVTENVTTVINDSPNRWPATTHVTGRTGYIRFHGSRRLYRSSYSESELQQWADFIKRECKSCQNVYVYFNNDYNAVAVANAKSLITILK